MSTSPQVSLRIDSPLLAKINDGTNATANAITIEAGFGTVAVLEAVAVVSCPPGMSLSMVHIEATFRGRAMSKWQGAHADILAAEGFPFSTHFHAIVESVFDKPTAELNSQLKSGLVSLPFRMKLDSSTPLPPTFTCPQGSLSYTLRCKMSYLETGKFQRINVEADVPVIIVPPVAVVQQLLQTSDQTVQHDSLSEFETSYRACLLKPCVPLGESVEVDVNVISTPAKRGLCRISLSLETTITFKNENGRMVEYKADQSLAHITQNFNCIQIGATKTIASINRKLFLFIDPQIASLSFESPLASVHSYVVLRIFTAEMGSAETTRVKEVFPLKITSIVPDKIVSSPVSSPTPLSSPVASPGHSRTSSNTLVMSPTFYTSNPVLPQPIMQIATHAVSKMTIHGSNSQPRNSLSSITSPPHLTTLRTPPIRTLESEDAFDTVDRCHTLPLPPHANDTDGHRIKAMQSMPVLGITTVVPKTTVPFMDILANQSLDFKGPHYPPDSGLPSYPVQQNDSPVDVDISSSPNSWSVAQVGDWLKSSGASEDVVETFSRHGIDGEVLLSLSEADLKSEMGMVLLGERRKIIAAIQRLKTLTS
ncbi:hypothetical protein BC830DRAFT_1111396 [Chytriomyces sp. MP71]|nr:hypothetical protein BC830DRAFT_1111396 [Chytriomyces sp. MP71]